MKNIYLSSTDSDDKIIIETALKLASDDNELLSVDKADDLIRGVEKEGMRAPDMIFMEVGSAVITDLYSIEDFTATPGLKKAPIVVISAIQDPTIINAMYDKGADCFINKPHSFQELISLLKTLFKDPLKLKQRSRQRFVLNQI